MKLRVRIRRQTSRVELTGQEPRVTELIDYIRGALLSSHGLSADTHFSLSLNGSELLSDSGQTLSSCGIVSGDLICVVLPETAATADASAHHTEDQQAAAMTTTQPTGGGSGAVGPVTPTQPEFPDPSEPSEPGSSSWEPMLCDEAENGHAPVALELLYHSAQVTSPSDAVMVAANQVMLETGFVPQCVCCVCVPGCELDATRMPPGWRLGGGVYRLQYAHPLCQGCPVTATAICMGPLVVINANLKVDQTVSGFRRKLCLNPCSYVTDEWPGGSAAAAFRDLKKMSRVFKDQLAYPLISAARAAMDLPVAFGLAALPPELLLRVLRLLDVCSVVRLSAVCKHFHAATADSTLWRHLFHRDFTDSRSSTSRDTDWKERYKTFHKSRCEQRRTRHRSLPPFPLPPRGPPFHPFHPFHPVPLYPPLPGIIGGEYDQRPELPRGLLPRPRYDPIGPPQGHHRRPTAAPPGSQPTRGFI